MASAALSSSSYSTTTTSSSTNLRAADDSFATYLSLISQSFSVNLALSRPPSTNNPNSARRSSSPSFSQKRTDDGELDVFTAEKYFNGTLDTTTTTTDNTTLLDHPNIINNKISKTPQINNNFCSEKTTTTTGRRSTNSWTVLPRGGSHQQQNDPQITRRRGRSTGRRGSSSFLDVFRCICLKKNYDVDVEEEDDAEIMSNSRKWRRKRRSESSSELFEIESLNSVLPAVGAGGYVINGYAPSEASIEWSVATASAVNMSTTMMLGATSGRKLVRNGSEEDGMSRKRRSSASSTGMLMVGCASENAASVVRGEGKWVGSLERYRAMMDFESASTAGAAPTSRPRRASLG